MLPSIPSGLSYELIELTESIIVTVIVEMVFLLTSVTSLVTEDPILRQSLNAFECIPGFRNFLIFCCYFVPSVRLCALDFYLESVMERTDITKYNILIVGDFNAGGYDWGDRLFYPNCHSYARAKISSIKTFWTLT